MYDKSLAIEILRQIHETTQTILRRFEIVISVDNYIELYYAASRSGFPIVPEAARK